MIHARREGWMGGREEVKCQTSGVEDEGEHHTMWHWESAKGLSPFPFVSGYVCSVFDGSGRDHCRVAIDLPSDEDQENCRGEQKAGRGSRIYV